MASSPPRRSSPRHGYSQRTAASHAPWSTTTPSAAWTTRPTGCSDAVSTEIERKLRQHDNDITEIYAKLVTIERKADEFKVQVETRFDRVETHLKGIEVVVDTRLGDLDDRVGDLNDRLGDLNDRLGVHLGGISTHLTGIDAHLSGMDATLAEMLQRLPETA